MNEEKMREDFRDWYGTAYPNTTWAPEDWILWQAACASKQKEIDILIEEFGKTQFNQAQLINDEKQQVIAMQENIDSWKIVAENWRVKAVEWSRKNAELKENQNENS